MRFGTKPHAAAGLSGSTPAEDHRAVRTVDEAGPRAHRLVTDCTSGARIDAVWDQTACARSPKRPAEPQSSSSASMCGNVRCSVRRCGATAGCRYFAASAPSPVATRASAHSARLRAV